MSLGRSLIRIAVLCTAAVPAHAETTQSEVLACFAEMGRTTDWNTCLNTLFAPCADQDIGTESHLECLIQINDGWRASKDSAEDDVLGALTPTGAEQLSGLLHAWPSFVQDKCVSVAEGRAQLSFEAALLGCQISEYALMTNELTACAEGRSVEEYCQLAE